MTRWRLAGAALLALAPMAAAGATWCVPGPIVGQSCANIVSTVQEAIDAAPAGSTIKIGAGTPPERLAVTKRLNIDCFAGSLLTDAGLESGAALVAYTGTYTSLPMDDCALAVATSTDGVTVAATVSYFRFDGGSVTRIAGAGGAGIRIDGATRPSILHTTVTGFETGIRIDHATWFKVQTSTVSGHAVGVDLLGGNGQVFWNTIRENGVGLRAADLFQADLNSDDYLDNGVAVQWGLGNGLTEFNHDVLTGNTLAFRVETAPGVFAEGTTAYLQSAGCSEQWADLWVDGVLIQGQAFTTDPC